MVWSPQENDAFFGEPQEDAREPDDHADDAAPMCVWCETRVPGSCKSRYDTLTCTHRVIVPTAEEWDSAIEARAAELHEGCRMPMEQARAIAASEESPDWYARGQDWGLADALTAGQDGDWTLDDIARAFAAGAQAGATVTGPGFGDGVGPIAELVACLRDNSGRHINGLYDKRAADELERLAELADSEGTRAVNCLRRARKAEKVLRELVALEDMRLRLRQLHEMGHGTDYADYHRLLPLAWDSARLALGPNV